MIDDSDFIFAQSLREKKCFCWCHTNTLGTILRRFPLWFPQLSKLASFLVHQLFGPPKLTPCAFILRTRGVYQINHKEATKKYPKSVTPPFSKFRDPKSKCHYGPPKSTIFIRIPRPPPPKQSRGVLKVTISRQYFWNHGMYFYQWLHGRHQFRFPAWKFYWPFSLFFW